jgi:Zn-dependent peptidase ImmA (M78 family)
VEPTIGQLRKAAKLYKRPLAVLLLPEPPIDFQPLRDFRKVSGAAAARPWSPALHAEFKRAISQREVILELRELAPASVHAPEQTVSVSDQLPPDEVARHLRTLLGLDTWTQTVLSDRYAALKAAIAAVEDLGVLVLQASGIDSTEMRGFSLSEWPWPVIVLNGSDWPRGRLFTLLHELCHLAINAGGLCDLHERPAGQPRVEDRLEAFCNEVAAGILMPRERFLQDPLVRLATSGYRWTLDELQVLTQRYGASSEAVLLRLVSLGLADWDLYWVLKHQLELAYSAARERERERQQESEGGPPFHIVKARNLGHGYVNAVLDAFHARAISSLDAADYLDVRFDQLARLEQAAAS